MKKVMVFGTFDILHSGHLHFLINSKKKGDYLIVIVGRDKNVIKFKGKKPIDNENIRLLNIKNQSFVDEVILGRSDHDYAKLLLKYKPNIICLGYDQNDLGLQKFLRDNKLDLKIIKIKPYKEKKYKSSIFRKQME
jgi:FAD synthetase